LDWDTSFSAFSKCWAPDKDPEIIRTMKTDSGRSDWLKAYGLEKGSKGKEQPFNRPDYIEDYIYRTRNMAQVSRVQDDPLVPPVDRIAHVEMWGHFSEECYDSEPDDARLEKDFLLAKIPAPWLGGNIQPLMEKIDEPGNEKKTITEVLTVFQLHEYPEFNTDPDTGQTYWKANIRGSDILPKEHPLRKHKDWPTKNREIRLLCPNLEEYRRNTRLDFLLFNSRENHPFAPKEGGNIVPISRISLLENQPTLYYYLQSRRTFSFLKKTLDHLDPIIIKPGDWIVHVGAEYKYAETPPLTKINADDKSIDSSPNPRVRTTQIRRMIERHLEQTGQGSSFDVIIDSANLASQKTCQSRWAFSSQGLITETYQGPGRHLL